VLDRNRVINWWLGRLTDAELAEFSGMTTRGLQLVTQHPRVKGELLGGGRGSRGTRRVPAKVRNAFAIVQSLSDAGFSIDLAAEIVGTFWFLPDHVNRPIDFTPLLSGVMSPLMHEPQGSGYLPTDVLPQHIAWNIVVPCAMPDNPNPTQGDVLYVPAHEWKPNLSNGHMRIEMPDGQPARELIPLTKGPVYLGEIDNLGLWLPQNTRVETLGWDDHLEIVNGRWIFHRESEPDGWELLQRLHAGQRGVSKNIEHRVRLLGEIVAKKKSVISFRKEAGDKGVSSLWNNQEAEPRAMHDYHNARSKLTVNVSLAVRRMKRRALGLKVDGEAVTTDWSAMPVMPWPAPAAPPMTLEEIEEEDFFRKYVTGKDGKQVKDEHGNRMLVGLTKEENDEYRAIDARSWQSRTDEKAFPWESVEQMHAEKDRWLELHGKHEAARIRRVAEEHIARERGRA
jgi:hypothetical protein